jgi:hypothetical protein
MSTLSEDHSLMVEPWMTTIVKDGGIDRFDDLYINRIEKGRADPRRWLFAAIQTFEIALKQRDRHLLALTWSSFLQTMLHIAEVSSLLDDRSS